MCVNTEGAVYCEDVNQHGRHLGTEKCENGENHDLWANRQGSSYKFSADVKRDNVELKNYPLTLWTLQQKESSALYWYFRLLWYSFWKYVQMFNFPEICTTEA